MLIWLRNHIFVDYSEKKRGTPPSRYRQLGWIHLIFHPCSQLCFQELASKKKEKSSVWNKHFAELVRMWKSYRSADTSMLVLQEFCPAKYRVCTVKQTREFSWPLHSDNCCFLFFLVHRCISSPLYFKYDGGSEIPLAVFMRSNKIGRWTANNELQCLVIGVKRMKQGCTVWLQVISGFEIFFVCDLPGITWENSH